MGLLASTKLKFYELQKSVSYDFFNETKKEKQHPWTVYKKQRNVTYHNITLCQDSWRMPLLSCHSYNVNQIKSTSKVTLLIILNFTLWKRVKLSLYGI